MIKPEQVPDAVVDALLDPSNVGCSWKEAIAAALNAWPGMKHYDEMRVFGEPYSPARLILPLLGEVTS